MTTFPSLKIGLITLFLLVYSCNTQSTQPEKPAANSTESVEKLDKRTRMDLAVQQEFEMTVDPALGRVPRERLLAAKMDLKRSGGGNQREAIAGINWEERGPNNVSGRTRDILIDAADPSGNTIYAGSVGGGLWKTENALDINPIWNSIDDFFENLAVCAIAQDPNDSDIMYFGTGEGFYNGDAIAGIGLWKSIDGGDTWDYLTTTSNSVFSHTQKIVINADGTVFAATRGGGIQVSFDGGDNWEKSLGFNQTAGTNRAADLEMAANGDLFAAMGLNNRDGIYKSSNDGANWTKLTNGLPSSDYERIEIACAPSNANVVYALIQDASDNTCKGVYVSTNGGNNWTQKASPGAFNMDNFARNQAWYDLIAAVDPNNPDRVFIGGVDLLVSNDAGSNWEQIGQWYGGGGIQYVHADQHSIKFLPGNSDLAFFGNDGGVFRTTNASAVIPNIDFISNGYNVTQFYGCAIHPGENQDYFLAGAQDNGTQRFTDPGLNNTFEVTGGDGGFCHIDQDNPDVQITTYVYNQYRISTNGGNSFSNRNFNNSGRFINPFAYDDPENILYGAHNNGNYLRWNDPAEGGSDFDIVSVSGFDGGKVSHVATSPNVENRIYFGLGNGDLVMVDDAHVGSSKTGTLLYNGSGYLSSVAIEKENEDHILITYSNYGVVSVFESTNGGDSWTAVEGNLPDVPIRWIIFSPNNSDEALVATEVGVWSTNNLDGSNTEWAPSNSGFANVRVDMLKTRPSDDLVIAATHGRGLYSTARFGQLFVGFDSGETQIDEFVSTGPDGACELDYQEIDIPVSVNRFPISPAEEMTLYFNAANTSTATLNEDVILLTDSLQFQMSDTEKTQYIRVRVFDDAIVEASTEDLIIEITTSIDVQTTQIVHTLTIADNDEIPDGGAIDYTAQVGTGDADLPNQSPFRGFWHDSKAQYLYLASDLTELGFIPGPISEIAFDVSSLGSTIDYNGFTISLKGTTTSEFTFNTFETDLQEVYSATYDPVEGWNNFVFDTPFEWNGTDNLIVQTCFDNSAYTLDDQVRSSSTSYISSINRYLDGDEGCALTTYNTSGFRRPNLRVRQLRTIGISDQVDRKTSYVSETETAHFYDSEGDLMLSITNLTGGNLGCVDVQIDQYGLGQVSPDWLNGSAHAEKTFLITSENDASYEITLYLSQAELAVWNDPTQLSILKTPEAINQHAGNNFTVLESAEVNIAPFGEEGDYTYTATFQSFSGFTITNAPPQSPLPLELLDISAQNRDRVNQVVWQTTNEVGVDYLELQRSLDGINFRPIHTVAAQNNAPQSNNYQYLDADLLPSEATYYYRLKMVDLDETFDYSTIASVNVGGNDQPSKVFPNPFSSSLNIVPATGLQLERVVINDVTGRTIKSDKWNGNPIQLQQLAAGVYWVKLVYLGGDTSLHKVVKSQ